MKRHSDLPDGLLFKHYICCAFVNKTTERYFYTMKSTVKNILVAILLVVLSPVTFALCPCMADTGKRSACCCKKSQLPAEKKCPSKKQLVRMQSLEKQCMHQQHVRLAPQQLLSSATVMATEGSNPEQSVTIPAQQRNNALNDPPSLFLQHRCFRI